MRQVQTYKNPDEDKQEDSTIERKRDSAMFLNSRIINFSIIELLVSQYGPDNENI